MKNFITNSVWKILLSILVGFTISTFIVTQPRFNRIIKEDTATYMSEYEYMGYPLAECQKGYGANKGSIGFSSIDKCYMPLKVGNILIWSILPAVVIFVVFRKNNV